MIDLINQQKKNPIKNNLFEKFAKCIFLEIPQINNKSITIVFVTNKKIKELNKQFRRKNKSTDVLSFPNEKDEFEIEENYLGDIVISVEQAKRQAIENNLSIELEIKQLILHGILHLCGYDHETDNGEMNELELTLRDKLGIS